MSVKNTLLGGTNWSTPTARIKPTDLNDTFDASVEYSIAMKSPIGSVTAWLKTFAQSHTGTNTSTGTNKLINSSENFSLSNAPIGSIVFNSTDNTWAYITAVDSVTTLTLSSDIFTATGKTYYIYLTPHLPTEWVECNGQTLSDADSVYNGQVIPNLNGNNNFLRGNSSSGGTGGSSTTSIEGVNITFQSAATHQIVSNANEAQYVPLGGSGSYTYPRIKTTGISILPPYYNIVWIMRIK